MELELAASTLEVTESGLVLRWSDGSRSRFHALWLRDNCSTGGPKGSDLRTFSVVDLNPELFVLDAELNEDGDLVTEFSDGHESVFTFDWLREHSHEVHDTRGRPREIEHLRAGGSPRLFDLPRRGSEQHHSMINSLVTFGAVLVAGVPSDGVGVSILIDLFGGQVVAQPDLEDGVVDLRTDEATCGLPSAVVMLAATSGASSGNIKSGESFLVDGFGVAADLRDRDPDAFDALAHTEVPFIRVDDGGRPTRSSLDAVFAPVIALDRHQEIVGIRFDEAAMGPLDVAPSDVGEFYRALISFASMLRDPGRAVHVDVPPGHALVVDNRRMLRGGVAQRDRDVVAMVSPDEFRAIRRALS